VFSNNDLLDSALIGEQELFIMHDSNKILIEHAAKARENAYPYFSGFKVGAALLCEGGNVFTGCNIENPSIGLSICAERVAIIKTISEGYRILSKMAIVADTQSLIYPCGLCRQLIWEFAPDIQILLGNLEGRVKSITIRDLLPEAFDFHHVRDDLDFVKINNTK